MNKQILVVDDEESVRTVIRDGLVFHGYAVATAANADEALGAFERSAYDLALIDLKMPGALNGLQLLGEIQRRWPETITVVLTGYATLDSAIAALRQGASDYLRKPVSITEISHCVQSNLLAMPVPAARAGVSMEQPSKTKTLAKTLPEERFFRSPLLFIDRLKHLAMFDNQMLPLTPLEFSLLDYLVFHRERVVSAAELLQAVQGYEIDETDARPIVRVHIQHLRQKLKDDAATPTLILNVRGKGYRYIG